MEQTWRWYGPQDPVTLSDARQAGATGIVNALHEKAPGEIWSVAEIEARKALIEAAGLRWSVVESVNVSEAIKQRRGPWQQHIANYIDTLRNLAGCGIRTVCYNFMPVLDWSRTQLDYRLPDGAETLRFDATAFAAFDLFQLQRPGAEEDWPEERRQKARVLFDGMSEGERESLQRTALAGLPGSKTGFTLDYVREQLAAYREIHDNLQKTQLRIRTGILGNLSQPQTDTPPD